MDRESLKHRQLRKEWGGRFKDKKREGKERRKDAAKEELISGWRICV